MTDIQVNFPFHRSGNRNITRHRNFERVCVFLISRLCGRTIYVPVWKCDLPARRLPIPFRSELSTGLGNAEALLYVLPPRYAISLDFTRTLTFSLLLVSRTSRLSSTHYSLPSYLEGFDGDHIQRNSSMPRGRTWRPIGTPADIRCASLFDPVPHLYNTP